MRCDVAAAGTGIAALVPCSKGGTDMTRSGSAPRVPSTVREVFDDVAARTDAFCRRHLDEEYTETVHSVDREAGPQAALAADRGDRDIWAAGIVYPIGRVNFLADPNQTPHLRTEELARLWGVKQTTMANKGRLIMDSLHIGLMDPEFSRRDMIERNPMVWLLRIDGLLVDARDLPEALQVELCRRGLIPYVPARASGESFGLSHQVWVGLE